MWSAFGHKHTRYHDLRGFVGRIRRSYRIRQQEPNAGCNVDTLYPAYNKPNTLIYMVLQAG